MNQLLQFVAEHWALWMLLVFIIALLAANEFITHQRGVPQLSPAEAVNVLNRQEGLILDIRETTTFSNGHIIDAINVPQADLTRKLPSLDKYKARPLIIACGNGQNAAASAKLLRENAFENVNILKGGIASWTADNMPLQKA